MKFSCNERNPVVQSVVRFEFLYCIWLPPTTFQSPSHNRGVKSTGGACLPGACWSGPLHLFLCWPFTLASWFPCQMASPSTSCFACWVCGNWCVVLACCPASVQLRGCRQGCLRHKGLTKGSVLPKEGLGRHLPVVCVVGFLCRFPLILHKFWPTHGIWSVNWVCLFILWIYASFVVRVQK